MKVLLIVHDVYQNDNEFPLGEAYLAAVLRKDGHDVSVLCADVYHYTNEYVADYIRRRKFDIIGIGFMAARFTETILSLCKAINSVKGNAKLILGGHGPSATPEYMLEATGADAVIIGEAESIISGITVCINNGNRVVRGVPFKHLDEIPFPAWDLFPMDKYIDCKLYPGQKKSVKSVAVITSRGCVNRCSFCYRLEKGIRFRKMANVVEEIKYLHHNYGVDHFEFSDECFITNKRRLERLNQQLQDNNLNINYWCAARVDVINEEVLSLMKEGGCKFINYGFESMDENVLRLMNKNATPEDNERAARLTKDAGIQFGLNFIWNMPGDTKESLRQNVAFIKKYNTYGQLRTIRPVTPYPGSPLYYRAIEDGLLGGPADFYNRFKNSDLVTVNFMDIPTQDIYNELYFANCELINDMQLHSPHIFGPEWPQLKADFYRLYFEGKYEFRGARHYEK